MNVAVIGGLYDSKSFVIATHVAILARHKFPPFQYRTHPVDKEDFEKWLVNLCEKEHWALNALRNERVVCWYEVGAPGGPKRLLGGLYAFLEYMSDNYGVQRQLTLQQVETILQLRQEQIKHDKQYDGVMRRLKTTLTISIIGAGSNPTVNMIIYALLRLKGRPLQDGLYIRLYDKHESKYETMRRIKKHFNAMENNIGYGFVSIFKDFKELLEDCDVLIFLGENFRTKRMDVEKFLFKERVLYGLYGTLCNRYLKSRTRIIFCCMENSCFNATVFMERAPTLNLGSTVAITSNLGSEVKVYISKVSGFPIENIVDIPVWGMTDISHVVDVSKARLLFRYRSMKEDFSPSYESFKEKCGISSKILVSLLEKIQEEAALEGKEYEKKDKKEERKLMKEVEEKRTSALLDVVRKLSLAADKGDNEAKTLLYRVQQDLLELVEDEQFSLNAFTDGAIGIYNKSGSSFKERDLHQLLEYELNKFFQNNLKPDEEVPCGEEHLEENLESENSRQTGSFSEQQFIHQSESETHFKGMERQTITPEEFKASCYKDAEDLKIQEDKDGGNTDLSSECSKEQDEKYEMRKLGYISDSLKNMWHYVGIAKGLVRRETHRDPFIGQVWELMNLLKIWILDPCRKNEVIFLGVASNGLQVLTMSQSSSLTFCKSCCKLPQGICENSQIYPEEASIMTSQTSVKKIVTRSTHEDLNNSNKNLQGSYSLPKGYIMSQPATLDGNQCWQPYLYGEHTYLDEGEGSCYNPHRDPPTKRPPKYPELCTLSSAVNIARMCLKHFSISPELDTDEDNVERRLQEKEILGWRLEKMEAEYEYRELKQFYIEENVPVEEVYPEGMGEDVIQEGGTDIPLQSVTATDLEKRSLQSVADTKELEPTDEEAMKLNRFTLPEDNGDYDKTDLSEEEEHFEMKVDLENYGEGTSLYEKSAEVRVHKNKDSEGRDIIHKKYLEELGFYDISSEEEFLDEDGLEPEYQKLMKTAFKEYFDFESDEDKPKNMVSNEQNDEYNVIRDHKLPKEHQIWPAADEGDDFGEDYDYRRQEGAEEESFDIGNLESFSSTQSLSCQGIGMNPLIEEELGNPHHISTIEAEALPDSFPQFDKEHEYEKSYSKKPGFPFDFQRKSTIDTYKMLLKVDPAVLREKFEALASKIDSIYEEEIEKGNIIEEEDGTVIVNESTDYAESYKNEYSLDENGSLAGIDREESSNSTNDILSQAHPMLPITSSNLQAHSGCILPEKQVHCNDLSISISKVEKAMELGILTIPEKELYVPEENDMIHQKDLSQQRNNPDKVMMQDKENKLHQCREKLWLEYKKILEMNECAIDDGSSVKLQALHDETLQTDDEIKAKCEKFVDFVNLSREHTWISAELRGDTLPTWHFRSKKEGERYKDFKVKSLICGMALRNILLMRKNEAYSSHNDDFIGTNEDAEKS